jgi:hypothetical protein
VLTAMMILSRFVALTLSRAEPPRSFARLQERVVDLPRVGAPGQLEDRLDQRVLDRIEMPIRHALTTVAQVQRQQVAGLDLVADPPAGLARHLRVLGDWQVVWCLEDIDQFHPLALYVGQRFLHDGTRQRHCGQPMRLG